MLRVSAGKIGNPVLMLVLMKTDDRGWFSLFHLSRVVHVSAPPLDCYKA